LQNFIKNYLLYAKSRDEELETETEILRDRDETWDLRDRDSKIRVSRRVSRPRSSLETPSMLLIFINASYQENTLPAIHIKLHHTSLPNPSGQTSFITGIKIHV